MKKFEAIPEEFGCDPDALVTVPNIPLFSGAARYNDLHFACAIVLSCMNNLSR